MAIRATPDLLDPAPRRAVPVTPEVSVVIPCAGSGPHLGEQLAALAAQRTGRSWEVVLADNGMDAECSARAQAGLAALPAGRVVDARAVRGPSYARTEGARQARGDLLLFCDDDDVVDVCWVEEMAHALAHADLVGGRLRTDRLNAGAIARSPMQEDGLPAVHDGRPYVMSCSLGVRRAVFESVGGFDPALYPGEDVDLGLRVQAAGGTLAFVPAAVVDYRWRSDPRGYARQQASYGRTSGLLARKHAGVTPPLRPVAEVVLAVRLAAGVRHVPRPGPRRTRWWGAVRYWAAFRRQLVVARRAGR